MILIYGSTRDDVSYFETRIQNKKEETIFGKYKYLTGTMSSQKVGVAYGGYTNYLSTAIISTVLAKNVDIVLVINVGKCSAYGEELKTGDIVISRQAYLAEVNQVGIKDAILGQVPTCPQIFATDAYVLELLNNCVNKIIKKNNSKIGTFMSMEKILHKREDFDKISTSNGVILGNKEDVVFDSCTGGVALSCYLHNIPYISIEVVENRIDEAPSISNYVKVIEHYLDIGKAVASFIGEISRNDVIIGNE